MDKPKLHQLPVRVRSILRGDGGTSSVRTVLCPSHGQAVGLTVCAECSHCEQIGSRGDQLTVSCSPETTRPMMRWTPLLHRILPSAADRVAIAEVMQREVSCVTRDVSLEKLTALFLDTGISAAPVVDDEGFPIGMVSKTDLVREGRAASTHRTVEEVMVHLAFRLAEDEPLSRAAAVMDAEGVHHLPVVSSDGRVVGILSSLDFVRWVARQSAFADQV